MRAGQGDRQLDQPQGGRGRVPRAGAARPPLRRGGRRDGVRRAGPGRHRRATRSHLPARLRAAHRGGRLPADDIIFDPNILTVATGIEEHNNYARRLHRGDRAASRRPARACRSRGGVSNVSFSFRGNDVVREAMHAAFLYHAIQAGLDMGIVNAGQLAVYEEIPKDLLELRRGRAAQPPARRDRAAGRASPSTVEGQGQGRREADQAWRERAGRGAAQARAGQGHRRLHRRRTSRRRGRSTAGRCRSSKAR